MESLLNALDGAVNEMSDETGERIGLAILAGCALLELCILKHLFS